MASSKVVMASTSTTNTDLPRQSSVCSLSTIIADLQQSDPSKNLSSMNMDDLLKNIYSDAGQNLNQTVENTSFPVASISQQGSFSLPKDVASKTVDEVWKEIIAGTERRQATVAEGMTLEDFLTKAGAVREEEVGLPVMGGLGGYGVDTTVNRQFQMQPQQAGPMVAYGNGIDGRVVGVRRGKRRAAVEEPVDKATQQKQRRMIKNRESAARSRERKQAYTVELESLVTQLEEENARLLRQEAEQIKERCKQLKENLIPVDEKRRPPRVLRRVHSVHW